MLDCGASDGDFTRQALAAGAQTVVSVEISPSSAECIRRNLAAEAAAGRVIVYPKGVWDKDDTLTLKRGRHQLRRQQRGHAPGIVASQRAGAPDHHR